MKIAIVAPSPVPYDPGGAEAVWAGLFRELAANTPHDVELIKIPIRESTLPEVMTAYQAFDALDLDHFDLVISGKYPAWMVTHPNHVVYLLHPLRGLYDSYSLFNLPTVETSEEPRIRELLSIAGAVRSGGNPAELFWHWRTALAELGPDHPSFGHPGPLGRTLVRALDAHAMRPDAISRYFAISRTVAARPDYFPRGVSVKVVYPPSDLAGLHEGRGEFFFTTSRHDGPKRLDLLIKGMNRYRGSLELVIGGRGPESSRLEQLAAGDPRIRFVGRLSQTDLVDHYARAVGVPFIPLDEDLGLITIEALTAGKPVLTSRDAGGPTEFVLPGRNGIVVDPTPEQIGAGLGRLQQLAIQPSTAAAARRAVQDISWATLAEELVGGHHQSGRRLVPIERTGRPRLVVTSTFPIWPPRGGGQLRAFHLYSALSRRFDIDVLCLAHPTVAPGVMELSGSMTEYTIPRSADHEAAEMAITAEVGFPITDIVAGQLVTRTPEYLTLLEQLMAGAHAVLLADPFLNPAVRMVRGRRPIIYDAFNCEYVLKSQLLPNTEAGDRLRSQVLEVEGDASRDASLIMTVSDQDRESLRRYYDLPADKFVTVPNGVDLERTEYTPMAQRLVNRRRWLQNLNRNGRGVELTSLATFVGSWHPPNNAAGRAIVDMAPELPEVGFLLMGGHCGTLSHLDLPPNVFLLGIASNTVKNTVLRSVDIALAPLSSGSGTNLKVVEYMAAGIPLISTAIGMRGLDIEPDLVRVAAVADFPAAIRAELADAEGAVRRTERARERVATTYGWRALGEVAIQQIERVLRLRTSEKVR